MGGVEGKVFARFEEEEEAGFALTGYKKVGIPIPDEDVPPRENIWS